MCVFSFYFWLLATSSTTFTTTISSATSTTPTTLTTTSTTTTSSVVCYFVFFTPTLPTALSRDPTTPRQSGVVRYCGSRLRAPRGHSRPRSVRLVCHLFYHPHCFHPFSPFNHGFWSSGSGSIWHRWFRLRQPNNYFKVI